MHELFAVAGRLWILAARLFAAAACLALPIGCAMQPPTQPQSAPHAQYPVVAADLDDTFIGTVDNNLQTATAFVAVHGEKHDTWCRGEGHLVRLSGTAAGCAGGRGECHLTCDDGRQIGCQYELTSCTSGVGLGMDQDRNWFAFGFGAGLSGSNVQAAAQKLKDYVASMPVSYNPAQSRKEKGYAIGTGFFAAAGGYVITAFHVVQDAGTIRIMTRAGKTLHAELIAADAANDVALLKVSSSQKGLPIVTSVTAAPGDEVMTLGYPLIQTEGQEQKAGFGHVNALSGIGDDVRFLQIDVPIAPGNSGGPLLNARGQVIGIIDQTADPQEIFKDTGTLPQNINYAVKSDYILPLLARYEIPTTSAPGAARTPAEIVRQVRDAVVMVIAQ